MDLEQHDELLSGYLDHELRADDRVELARLLEKSSSARAQLQDLEAAGRLIRSLPRHAADGQFADDVISRLASESLLRQAKPLRRRAIPMYWWPGVAAAAAAVVAGVWLMRPRAGDPLEIARNDAPARAVGALPDPADLPGPAAAEQAGAPLAKLHASTPPAAEPLPQLAETLKGTEEKSVPMAGDVTRLPSDHDWDHYVLVVDVRDGISAAEQAVETLCLKYSIPVESAPSSSTERAAGSEAMSMFVIDAPAEKLGKLVSEFESNPPSLKDSHVASVIQIPDELAKNVVGLDLARERVADPFFFRARRTPNVRLEDGQGTGTVRQKLDAIAETRTAGATAGSHGFADKSRTSNEPPATLAGVVAGNAAAPKGQTAAEGAERGAVAREATSRSGDRTVAQRLAVPVADLKSLQELVAKIRSESRQRTDTQTTTAKRPPTERQTMLLYIISDPSAPALPVAKPSAK
jgi:hypothetical protein